MLVGWLAGGVCDGSSSVNKASQESCSADLFLFVADAVSDTAAKYFFLSSFPPFVLFLLSNFLFCNFRRIFLPLSVTYDVSSYSIVFGAKK